MQTTELYELVRWIDDEIRNKQIQQKFQQLQSKLQANVQPNQQSQPFEAEKDDLIAALREVPINSLSNAQQQYLDKLSLLEHLSDAGEREIEDILYRNAIDIATAATRIQQIVADFSNALTKTQQLEQGLNGLVESLPTENEDAFVRVTFTNDAAMDNLADFKSWGETWYDIGRGISMAHGQAPESIRIVGASNGSIVIDLAAFYGFVKTITLIINEALVVVERVQNIKLKAEEIRAMQLENDDAARALEEQVDAVKKNGTNKIIESITQNVDAELDGEGKTALGRSVRKLVNFLDKGGDVDCILPPESDEEEGEGRDLQPDHDELRQRVENIRHLKKSIKRITHRDS